MKERFFLFSLLLPFFSFAQPVDTALARMEVDNLFKKVDEATKQRNFEQALTLLDQAEEKASMAFGKESELYVICLEKRGVLFYDQGSLAEVEPLWQEVLAIRGKVLGKEHLDYAHSLNNLGRLYSNMGNYEKGEILHLEALAIKEKVLGRENPGYAVGLFNLGLLYGEMGNYEKAEPLFQEALAIREKVLGKGHPDYALSLASLGTLYGEMGDYEKAEPLYYEALAAQEKVLGKENLSYAGSLGNLGNLYWRMGNYEKTEPLFQEVLAILEKMLGKEHPYYAQGLSNLGLLYETMNNYDKAETLYQEALAIWEKTLGKGHPNYASSLNNLGNLYWRMDNYEKAETLYREALAIWEKVLGREHPTCALSLTNLGLLYGEMGNYEKAETLCQEALGIREKTLGKEHPDYAYNLLILGNLHWEMSNLEKAETLILETNEIAKTFLARACRHLSERELSAYIRSFIERQGRFYSFAQIRRGLSGHIYNDALFHKGFLLNAIQGARRLAQSDSASWELSLRHKSCLTRLSAEYAKPVAERQNVTELEEKANALEKELIRAAAGYGEIVRQVKWKEVQAALQAGEAAVEFVHYRFFDPGLTDSTFYAALVLRPGDERPHFVPLFEEKALASLLARNATRQTRQFITEVYSQGVTPAEKSQGEGLHGLTWRPLDSLLAGVNTIYASPAGLLHRINLGAIRIDSSRTIADKYRLSILGSTRQLVVGSGVVSNDLSATIYGGIQYDMDSTAIASASMGQPDMAANNAQLSFSYLGRAAPERGRSWDYLPATAEEADKARQVVQAKGGQAQAYTGYAATEESFKQMGREELSPRIIHLATHGYFFPEPEEEMKSSRPFAELPAFKISHHPMIRSGLILAGGNHAWRGNKPLEGMEDGILTAYEISQVNLGNTELAVLSACETGLGDIEGNEGVYGLQRAFKIAGVKNIIMSLWPVPDQQTQEMIVLFYEYWLNEEMEIADAFRAAQQEMRNRYEDHYFWAAFVLIE